MSISHQEAEGYKERHGCFAFAFDSSLISTLAGAIALFLLVHFLGGRIQHDFRIAELREQATIDFRERRYQASVELYGLAGNAVAIGASLEDLGKPPLQLDPSLPSDIRESLVEQRSEIINEFNEFNQTWREKRETAGATLIYYYEGNEALRAHWLQLEGAVNLHLQCSKVRGGVLAPTPSLSGSLCESSRGQLITRMDEFLRSMAKFWRAERVPKGEEAP